MTLDGLEQAVLNAVPRRSRVNFIRYADDFVITGKSKTLLVNNVKPAVERFLAERGLHLSEEKTTITHITEGFTFLGQTFRKHGNVLHITPSKEGVLALIRKVGALIRLYTSAPIEALIKKLNEILRGWANYHRHVVASSAFKRVDNYVYYRLWGMLRRRHPGKSTQWLVKHYWTASNCKWDFSVARKRNGTYRVHRVARVSSTPIVRHVKIRADANPYAQEFSRYFWERRHKSKASATALPLKASDGAEVNRRAIPSG